MIFHNERHFIHRFGVNLTRNGSLNILVSALSNHHSLHLRPLPMNALSIRPFLVNHILRLCRFMIPVPKYRVTWGVIWVHSRLVISNTYSLRLCHPLHISTRRPNVVSSTNHTLRITSLSRRRDSGSRRGRRGTTLRSTSRVFTVCFCVSFCRGSLSRKAAVVFFVTGRS